MASVKANRNKLMPRKRELCVEIGAVKPKKNSPISADNPQSFCTRVAGVTFEGRQRVVERCSENETLTLVREPKNKYDKGAVKVMRSNGEQLGFVHKSVSRYGDPTGLASQMDSGNQYPCRIIRIDGVSRQGVLIEITNCGPNKLTEGEGYDALVQRRLNEIRNGPVPTPQSLSPLAWILIVIASVFCFCLPFLTR
jgi:hypothetical protein